MGEFAKALYLRLLSIRDSLAKRIGRSGAVTWGDIVAFIIIQVGLTLVVISAASSFANPSPFWLRTAILGSAVWIVGVVLLSWRALNRVRGLKPLKLGKGHQVLERAKTPLKLMDLRELRKGTLKKADLKKMLKKSKWE